MDAAAPYDLAGDAAILDGLATIGETAAAVLPPPRHPSHAVLRLPASTREALVDGLADPARAALLRLHHLEAMPFARLQQLLAPCARGARLFFTPSPWAALPTFLAGLASLERLFDAHGLDPVAVPDFTPVASFAARFETVADWYVTTHFGGSSPMFQALPHDLAEGLPDPATATTAELLAAADRRLAFPMLHEVLHFSPSRAALQPPYLDEAIAGHLGVLVARASVYPDGDDDRALYGFPWFSQVGEALCRAFGTGSILAAHVGLESFDVALPAGLAPRLKSLGAHAARATGSVHFHPDTARPERWTRLFYAVAAGLDPRPTAIEELDALPPSAIRLPADPGADAVIIEHGLRALTLRGGSVGASLRVSAREDAVPVVADFDAGLLRLGASDVQGAICTRYALPPRVGSGRLVAELSGRDVTGRDGFARAILARLA